MDRRSFFLASQIVIVGLVGCNPAPPRTSGNTVGSMSKADVEAKLKADLKLMEISLTEESKWKYAGTGKSEDGAHWTITVAQSENELKWTNENDRGVKGTGSFRYQGTGPVGSVPGSGSSGFRTR